jgi:hypothetical protein
VQIGDNRAAEWVRRSNPVALGLLFSGLAGQQQSYVTAVVDTAVDDTATVNSNTVACT